MTLELMIITYGYPAVVIGTLLEGETVLLLAGFLAQRGYLELSSVIGCAFLGAFLADQLCFWLGRTKGISFFPQKPFFLQKLEKAENLIYQYKKLIIIGYRFIYGIRTITPFAIGISKKIPARQFVLLNAVSTMGWAAIIGSGGYLFGGVLGIIIDEIKSYELKILAIISIAGIMVGLVQFYRHLISKKLSP